MKLVRYGRPGKEKPGLFDEEGRLRVMGSGQRESRGVKRGYVTDMDASEVAIREAVESAERMSGVTVDDV